MKKEFGEPSNRWSIRWSVLGVDIRSHEPKDYFKFTMFYTQIQICLTQKITKGFENKINKST